MAVNEPMIFFLSLFLAPLLYLGSHFRDGIEFSSRRNADRRDRLNKAMGMKRLPTLIYLIAHVLGYEIYRYVAKNGDFDWRH